MSLSSARHCPPHVSQRLCHQRVHLYHLLRDPKNKYFHEFIIPTRSLVFVCVCATQFKVVSEALPEEINRYVSFRCIKQARLWLQQLGERL